MVQAGNRGPADAGDRPERGRPALDMRPYGGRPGSAGEGSRSAVSSRLQRKRDHDVKMTRFERDRRLSMAWRVACGKLAFLSKKGAKRYVKHHWPGNAAVR